MVPDLAQLERRKALVELGHHARRQPPGGELLGQDELVVEDLAVAISAL